MLPFSPEAHLQSLLDVEAALAAAQAAAGVIPESCVSDIRAVASADRFDRAALDTEAERAGNLVIPLVNRLRDLVATVNRESARYVHHGATSQDILDTAFVLQLRASLPAVLNHLQTTMSSAGRTARAHATAPMAGRTWLQHASPITFGLKAAGWLDLIGRTRDRLAQAMERVLVVQLGGASGTLASLGSSGPRVVDALARELELGVPDMPWHTQRDRFADVAAALGITCGALGKIGRDLVLLAQSEVAEVREAPAQGQGTSSAMPHKQNPVRAVVAIAASIRAPGLVAVMLTAMAQEHERAAGGWQAEWVTLPELVQLAAESAEAIGEALGRLEVDTERMRRNLELDGGVALSEALLTAVSEHLPRKDAMALVERLCHLARSGDRPLRDVAAASPEVRLWFSPDQIHSLLTPENYLGSAALFVDRVLRRWSV